MKECTWDEELMIWHVRVQDKKNGTLQHWTSEVVIQCIGSLDRPKWGTTPGREQYRGVSWHTAHWRDDYDLTGKNIAIIGCGPSVAQIIPQIVDKVDHLTLYMRTPPVCLPRNDYKHSKCVGGPTSSNVAKLTSNLGFISGRCALSLSSHSSSASGLTSK